MEHKVETRGDSTYIYFSGDIDQTCAHSVRQILHDIVTSQLTTVVELSDVPVIDSSGVASLLDGEKTAKQRGHRLELAAPSTRVSRVLELAHLDRYFIIRDR